MHPALRILTAARTIEKAAGRVFKPHGLTSARFNILTLLSRAPEGMRASDLASALIVDPSNVTGLLKRMKREGLIAEMENRNDRRQYVVGLSKKGRVAWASANADYERCLALLVRDLPTRDLEAAERVLDSLESVATSLP